MIISDNYPRKGVLKDLILWALEYITVGKTNNVFLDGRVANTHKWHHYYLIARLESIWNDIQEEAWRQSGHHILPNHIS